MYLSVAGRLSFRRSLVTTVLAYVKEKLTRDLACLYRVVAIASQPIRESTGVYSEETESHLLSVAAMIISEPTRDSTNVYLELNQ